MPISLTAQDLAETLAFAHELANASAKITLSYFRHPLDIDNKDDGGRFDPVTRADREAEELIRDMIRARFPDDGIIGEEHGEESPTGQRFWVIDPIDGTRAYIAGLPLWGTLIALNDGVRPILGLIDHPATGERFVGAPDGAFLKCKKLAVRPCAALRDATLSTTDPDLFAPGAEIAAFRQVSEKVRLRRYGYDCYAYAMLAAGFIDIVVEAGLKTFDVQALIPVIEGAGGIITDWQGGPAGDGGQILAAGDRRVHQEALSILSSGATVVA